MTTDEYILNQLDNDANVIGYQPTLNYVKERTAVGEYIPSEDEENPDAEKDTVEYSKTLTGFSENTPSNVLDDIDFVLNNLERLKNKLADQFNADKAFLNNPTKTNSILSSTPGGVDTNYNSPINTTPKPSGNYNPYNDIQKLIDANNNGDEDFPHDFENAYDGIEGSVIPSLINNISDIETKLKNLAINIKFINYGDPNISLQDAKEIDNSYINRMRLYERKDNGGKINYLTISFDATLNKCISYSVYQDNKSAIKCAKVIDSHDYEESQATYNDLDLLTDMFNKIEDMLDTRSRGYMRNEELEIMQKSLYNYYEKRKLLNDTYNLYRNNPESKLLGRKVTEYSNDVNDAIKNVSRVLLYNQNYLNHISELEKQKYELQNIAKTAKSTAVGTYSDTVAANKTAKTKTSTDKNTAATTKKNTKTTSKTKTKNTKTVGKIVGEIYK